MYFKKLGVFLFSHLDHFSKNYSEEHNEEKKKCTKVIYNEVLLDKNLCSDDWNPNYLDEFCRRLKRNLSKRKNAKRLCSRRQNRKKNYVKKKSKK